MKKFLGEGGNGFVWLAQNSRGDEVAIKVLAKLEGKSQSKVYARFKDEVNVVRANSDIDGLLPIIDQHLPDELKDEFPWYAMPVCQSIDQYLSGKNFETVIQAILEVGKILVKLHERGISHRDIKPANILVKEGKFYLADFGLVDYPDKLDLTSTAEQVGAKWTIAPEMKRNSRIADGKPADIYSLTKTLWILLTGHKDGFDGQYDLACVNGLGKPNLTVPNEKDFFYAKPPLVYTKPIDHLLRLSTDDDPSKRPSAGKFVEVLSSWLATWKDFEIRNQSQWRDVQIKLFPFVIPQRAIWEGIESIVEILNYLGSLDSLNHMMLPNGGGLDLIGAGLGTDPNTIELDIGEGTILLVKPKRLIYENLDFDSDWNYFRLETGDLEPTPPHQVHHGYQELVEIAPLRYIGIDEWYGDQDGERRYSSDSRYITRIMRGDFLILQKTSTYNRMTSTYDGRHNQMGTDEFRNYLVQKIILIQQLLQDEQVKKISGEKGVAKQVLIFQYLEEVFRKEYLEKFNRSRT